MPTAFIIGGGIAGFNAAIAAAKKNYQIVLLEQASFFEYASSRNAAIARTYDPDPELVYPLQKSVLNMIHIPNLLNKQGLLLKPLERDYISESHPLHPDLKPTHQETKTSFGDFFSGLWIPANGAVDLSLLHAHLKQEVVHYATKITFLENAQVKEVCGSEWIHTIFYEDVNAQQSKLPLSKEDIVFLAAGSWSANPDQIGLQKSFPLNAYKRHLFFLKSEQASNQEPIYWSEQEDVYVKPENGGYLVSLCEEWKTNGDDYHADEKIIQQLPESLKGSFQGLLHLGVQSYWACLRTFSMDSRPILGWDPYHPNLFHVCGLGGKGVSLSLSLANMILAEWDNKNAFSSFSPQRFL
ncbi:MAG: FAD-binding oxidoreductase [Candidatus Hydrogenedentota bacterium]|nr:MAG: FAD-binding oxidoreductase [Candidatus Hydrogenedentota bacterium]